MSLLGSVLAFPLETVLRLLASTGKTGQLEVRSDTQEGTLAFSAGRLVSASIDDETGDLALGAIFAIEKADFEFATLDHARREDLEGELQELLDRAAGERDRFVAIRGLIPHDGIRFRLSERAAERAEITLSSEQWRTLLAVDGERDVIGIADPLRTRRLAALGVLADLARAGLVDPVEPSSGTGPEDGRRLVPRHLRPSQPPPSTPTGEAIVLRGSLAEFPLETVLQLLVATKKTGRVELRAGREEGTLGMAAGRLVAAVWGEDGEAGELALGASFTAGSGEFDFIPMAEAPAANLAGELDELLDRAAKARARLVAIRAVIPSERVRFRLSDRATARPEITLTSEQWRAILAVDGDRDVAGIAEHLRIRRLPAFVLLADLVRGGLVDTIASPEPAPTWEPALDPRLAAFETPTAPTVAEGAAPEDMAVSAPPEQIAREKKKGWLFGLLRREPRAAPAARAAPSAPLIGGGEPTPMPRSGPLARTPVGQLAAFSNKLVAEYDSGRYGKGRIESRMPNLLMRVDEQADPIDRPIPVSGDRIDISALEADGVPKQQALPYLATLVRQIYEDAERAFGRDKAKRGYREVRQRLFGKEAALLQAPEIAGRVPRA